MIRAVRKGGQWRLRFSSLILELLLPFFFFLGRSRNLLRGKVVFSIFGWKFYLRIQVQRPQLLWAFQHCRNCRA